MAQFDLNLSTRPFPAYRPGNVILVTVLVALVSVSVWQALGFVRFSAMTGEIRSGEETARVEAEALRKRVTDLESKLGRPEATAKLNEIGFLNHLIARKSLSWTRMFANLEGMVPPAVRLVTLTPSVAPSGVITLSVGLQGRSIADVTQFIERLEKSPVFEKIAVSVEEKRDVTSNTNVDITLTANYYPERDTR